MAQCDEFLYLGGNDIATHKSLPSRERGLKFYAEGALLCIAGRSLHGSVD